MSNHYSVLEISSTATSAEVKKSYHRLVRLHHPDKNTDADGELIRKINEAYSILSDQTQREKYDRKLSLSSSSSLQTFKREGAHPSAPEQPHSPYPTPSGAQGQNPERPPAQHAHAPPNTHNSNGPPPQRPPPPPNGFHQGYSPGYSQFWSQRSNNQYQNRQHYAYHESNIQGEYYPYDRNHSFEGHHQNSWNSYAPPNSRPSNGYPGYPKGTPNPRPQQHQMPPLRPNVPHTAPPNSAASKLQGERGSTPSGPQPPTKGNQQYPTQQPFPAPQQSHYYSNPQSNNNGVKIPPGAPTSALPQSWEKQSYQFNQSNSKTKVNQEQSTSNGLEKDNDKIRIPTAAEPLSAFAFTNLNISTMNSKPSPMRVNTAKHKLKHSRFLSPTKRPKPHKNASGRTPRTSVEDGLHVDFVSTEKNTSGSRIFPGNETDISEEDREQEKNDDEDDEDDEDEEEEPTVSKRQRTPDNVEHHKIFPDTDDFRDVPPFTQNNGSFDMSSMRKVFVDRGQMNDNEAPKEGKPNDNIFSFANISEAFLDESPRKNTNREQNLENVSSRKKPRVQVEEVFEDFDKLRKSDTISSDSDTSEFEDIAFEGPFAPKNVDDPNDDEKWVAYKKEVNSFMKETRSLQKLALKNYDTLLQSKAVDFDVEKSQDQEQLGRHIRRQNHQIKGIYRMGRLLESVMDLYRQNEKLRGE